MNPLAAKVLIPNTANRIPWTENAQAVVTKLLDFEINASSFLMDVEQLGDLKTEGLENDFDRAFEDFFYQIPEELRWKIFPVELEEEGTKTETAQGCIKPSRVAI